MKLPAPIDSKNKRLINVVLETPRGSRNKYVYDEENDFFHLKKILPFGTAFPLDFGFVPGTLGEDGQPLDVLVLMDFAGFPGCVVKCRCVGVILAEQKEKSKTFRNDRILAVPVESLTYAKLKNTTQLNPAMLDELIHFFEYYNKMEGKKFKFLKMKDETTALHLITRSIVKPKKKNGRPS